MSICVQILTNWRQALRSGNSDPIGDIFGIDTKAELKCAESDETITVSTSETNIKCNINQEINHLGDGIKLGLQVEREQNSDKLGRLAVFQGEAAVARLPPYLTVQMMRFFYKTATQSRAKIMRSVRPPALAMSGCTYACSRCLRHCACLGCALLDAGC